MFYQLFENNEPTLAAIAGLPSYFDSLVVFNIWNQAIVVAVHNRHIQLYILFLASMHLAPSIEKDRACFACGEGRLLLLTEQVVLNPLGWEMMKEDNLEEYVV